MTIRKNKRRGRGGSGSLRLLSLLSLLLAAVILLSHPAQAAEDSHTYSDATWKNGEYSSTLGDMAGRRLYVYGIIDSDQPVPENGTDADVVLNTDEEAGRLDMAMWLYRICGTEPQSDAPFTDVPEEYADAVGWLYEAGIVKGISSTLFGTGNITEHQVLLMFSRLLEWESEDYDVLLPIAEALGLLPQGPDAEVFTKGRLYQMLSALLDLNFPKNCAPVRAEIGAPTQITLDAVSYEDALHQIQTALRYVPYRFLIRFSEDCPQEDVEQFAQCFDWNCGEQEFPLIGAFSRNYPISCNQVRDGERGFKFLIPHYSEAYAVRADTQDWLRIYADKAYSAALLDFLEQYLLPLKELPKEYDRVLGAYRLLCELAAYDYSEYYSKIRPQAHSLLGFMENHMVVCDGYAKALQWMLLCFGIDSYEVVGDANGGCHAWNKIRLEGLWYNADICWDDGPARLRYFLKSDAYFEKNQHSFNDGFSDTAYASLSSYRSS